MAGLVLDTDVVSYLFKVDTRAAPYRPHLRGTLTVITFQTVAELHFWALRRGWGATRRAELARHLQQFVVQPWNDDLCLRWARLRDRSARRGHAIDGADAWQAATALYLGVPLLSHNRRHYAGVPELTLISFAPR